MTAPTADTDLTSLKARALKAYATKDYPLSADLYAQACEVQSKAQGDDNPKNAHLLYLYGRSLYKVAQAKSDVLGGGAANEKEVAPAKPQKGLEDIAEEEAVSEQALKKDDAKAKGLFQFQGDENWDDVDDEHDAPDEGAEGGEEEEDDMTQAWEILDLARVQFEKQLAAAAAEKLAEYSAEESTAETLADAPVDKPADIADSPAALSSDETRNIKTMLADVYDLLGEVSLESESFPQASKDLASSLNLKLELYEPHTTYLPEAHFKLALALEFSAAGEDVEEAEATRLREEAAGHLEKAIDSCRARIAREEAKLAASDSDNKGKGVAKSNAQIEDVQDMIKDLEQKLYDLRNPAPEPPVDTEPLSGLLGQLLGEDPSVAKKRIEAAMSSAQDVSGLVRKKPQRPVEPSSSEPAANGNKRKLDDEPADDASKKVKVDEAKDEAS